MITLRSALLALAACALAISCDHGTAPTPPSVPPPMPPPPPPPPPGSAVVSLTTPNSNDGALVLTLKGPGLTTMQASSSSNLFYSRAVSDSEARVILVGDLSAGPMFTFKVADGKQLSAYTATIGEVATRDDALRTSVTGYTLLISALP